ncbi:hypothetical protein ACJRO7_031479 [Eucalyptus globulus]|uniref:Glycosyltransferase n=1 Tax=Eucalyptus globulus TaxID=34317 RepID=A0ABD3JQJ7_EUCGL
MNHQHFLIISFRGQGHLNPTIQLAKRLVWAGAQVTYANAVDGRNVRTIKTPISMEGLSHTSFSVTDDDAGEPSSYEDRISEIKRVGSRNLRELIVSLSEKDRPVTFLIYTVLLPWAADVARDLGVPSAFLSIQSAAVFAIYHHYFNSRSGFYQSSKNEPPTPISLPGLPPLTPEDLPSFLLPTDPNFPIVPTFQEHILTLEKETNPCVLLNTFDALEEDLIKAGMENMKLFAIGPLIPLAYLDDKDRPLDNSFGCDLFDCSTDYLQWLDSKPASSVIYVSFGSLAVLKKNQMEELCQGLSESGQPFLWVIRPSDTSEQEEIDTMIKGRIDGDSGLIVPWCLQVEVLNHKSIGCHVTHCGWNSTLESLTAGVPMVACPQFSDQLTNAKLIQDVWGVGVKARADGEGVVGREEMKRCLDLVMGPTHEEGMRENASKWKALARRAVKESGSSDDNLRLFMAGLK